MEMHFKDTVDKRRKQCLAYPTNGNKSTKARVQRLLDKGDFQKDKQGNLISLKLIYDHQTIFWDFVRRLVLPEEDKVAEWDMVRTNYGLSPRAQVGQVEKMWAEIEKNYMILKRCEETVGTGSGRLEEIRRCSGACMPEQKVIEEVNVLSGALEEARIKARKKKSLGWLRN